MLNAAYGSNKSIVLNAVMLIVVMVSVIMLIYGKLTIDPVMCPVWDTNKLLFSNTSAYFVTKW